MKKMKKMTNSVTTKIKFFLTFLVKMAWTSQVYFYKFTTWENKNFEYSMDYARYNEKVEITSTLNASNPHFGIIPFTDKKMNLDGRCWNPNTTDNASKFESSIASEIVYEDKMFLTLDFPERTNVYKIEFSKKEGFKNTESAHSEDTKECSISRYDPRLKVTFSICIDDLGNVYIKRFGDNLSQEGKIKVDFERYVNETNKDKILDLYKMVLVSSGNALYTNLIIYKRGTKSYHSIYVSRRSVYSRSTHALDIKIHSIQYLCNTLLVFSEKIGTGNSAKTNFLNYYIPLSIGESLKGKKIRRFSEGVIKNWYVSKTTKDVVIESFSMTTPARISLIENKKSQHLDELIYSRYIYDRDSFEISELMLIQDPKPKNNSFYYLSYEDFDIVNLENMKIFILDVRMFWTSSSYKSFIQNGTDVKILQKFLLINDISRDSTWFSLPNGENLAEHVFTSEDNSMLFEYFNKNFDFIGVDNKGKDKNTTCRMLMRKFNTPAITVKYNYIGDKNPKLFNKFLNLTLVSKNDNKSQELKRYNFEFLDKHEEDKAKFAIWRGSNLSNILIHSTKVPKGGLKNFVRGCLIHQVINITRFPELTDDYKNDNLDYVGLYKKNRSVFKFITDHSFVEKTIIAINFDNQVQQENIKDMVFFEYELEKLVKTVAFVREKGNPKTMVYSLMKEASNNTEKLVKIGSVEMNDIKRVLPWKLGLSFILGVKGRMFVYDVWENNLTELEYIGEFCLDMAFFLHSSLELTLTCLTDSISLDFYYVRELFKNSRSKSMVPTEKFSLPIDDFLNDKDGKILYSAVHRDRIFVFFPKKRRNQDNLLLVNVDVEGVLEMNITKKMSLRPPKLLNAYKYGDIIDVITVDEFFVQLLRSGIKIYICVFTFLNQQEEFFCEKCYSLPEHLVLVPESKMIVLDSKTTSDMNLNFKRGFVSLIVFDKTTNSYNSAIIDTHSVMLETIPFFLYPINSKNRFKSFNYFSFRKDSYLESFGNFFYPFDPNGPLETFVGLVKHSEPSINLDINNINLLTHENIINIDRRLNISKEFYYVHYYDKQDIFRERSAQEIEDDSFYSFKLKTKDEISKLGAVLTSEVLIQQYLPEIRFEPKAKYNFSFSNETEIKFEDAYKELLKENDYSLMERSGNLNLLTLKLNELITGNIFHININLEYQRDFLFNNIEFIKPYKRLRKPLKLNTKSSHNGARFRLICIKNVDTSNPTSPCLMTITLYIDKTSIIGFGKTIPELPGKTLLDLDTQVKLLDVYPSCTIGDIYSTYFIRICTRGREKYFVIINFESTQEENIDLTLDAYSIKHLEIEVKGKTLSVIAKIRGVIKYVEVYYLSEINDIQYGEDNTQMTNRILVLTSIRSINLEADDFFVQYRTDVFSGFFGSWTFEKVYCGFIVCNSLANCQFKTRFKWSKLLHLDAKFGRVAPEKENHEFYLDKDVNVHLQSLYKYPKLTTIEDTDFRYAQTNHFILHFPNSNDFLLYGMGNILFDKMMRIRFSNPFKGLITISSVRPICKQWLCIFVSIFENNSYIRFYYIDWKFIKEIKFWNFFSPFANIKQFFKSGDLATAMGDIEDLRENYTFYTFSVMNYTGRIVDINWNTKVDGKDNTSFGFNLIDDDNVLTIYQVTNTLKVISNNLYISSSNFSLDVIGRERNTRKLRYRLKEFREPGFGKYYLQIFWIVLVSIFIFVFSWLIIVKQDVQMDEHYQKEEQLKGELHKKVKLVQKTAIDLKKSVLNKNLIIGKKYEKKMKDRLFKIQLNQTMKMHMNIMKKEIKNGAIMNKLGTRISELSTSAIKDIARKEEEQKQITMGKFNALKNFMIKRKFNEKLFNESGSFQLTENLNYGEESSSGGDYDSDSDLSFGI